MTRLLIYPFSSHRVRASSDDYDLMLSVDRLGCDDIKAIIRGDLFEFAFDDAHLSSQLVILKVLCETRSS